MRRRPLVLVASVFMLAMLAAAEAAEPAAAERVRDLVAGVGTATDCRVIPATGVAEAAPLAREAADQGARRVVLVVPQPALDAERAAWSELARDLRPRGASLQVYGVGADGAASSITWSGERSALLAPALAASPLDDGLGTAIAWEPSAAAAFERAAREDRLVLLVQLSGRFDAVPET